MKRSFKILFAISLLMGLMPLMAFAETTSLDKVQEINPTITYDKFTGIVTITGAKLDQSVVTEGAEEVTLRTGYDIHYAEIHSSSKNPLTGSLASSEVGKDTYHSNQEKDKYKNWQLNGDYLRSNKYGTDGVTDGNLSIDLKELVAPFTYWSAEVHLIVYGGNDSDSKYHEYGYGYYKLPSKVCFKFDTDGELDSIVTKSVDRYLLDGDIIDENLIPNPPTRKGYKFIGWYDRSDGGNKVSSFSGNLYKEYYAHWELIKASQVDVTVPLPSKVEKVDETAEKFTINTTPSNSYVKNVMILGGIKLNTVTDQSIINDYENIIDINGSKYVFLAYLPKLIEDYSFSIAEHEVVYIALLPGAYNDNPTFTVNGENVNTTIFCEMYSIILPIATSDENGNLQSSSHECDDKTFDVAFSGDVEASTFSELFEEKDVVNAYLLGNTTLGTDSSDEIVIPAGKTLNLCLNNQALTSKALSTFEVLGTLNVYDCGKDIRHFELKDYQADTSDTLTSIAGKKLGTDYIAITGGYITNSYNEDGGVGITCKNYFYDAGNRVECEGVFNFHGGNIIGCGISAIDCNKGTAHMYNGTIQGNTGSQGAGVSNGASPKSFHMHGGKIMYNTAWESGGGIYNTKDKWSAGDVTFDGNCYVMNNYVAKDLDDDDIFEVYIPNNFQTSSLASDVVAIFSGKTLDANSKIGVTLEEGTGLFIKNVNSNDILKFVSDVNIYDIRLNGTSFELYLNVEKNDGEITVPTEYDESSTSTTVFVSGDDNVEATGLDRIARDVKKDNTTEDVKIVLIAESKTESQINNETETNAIKTKVGNDKVNFIAVTLEKFIGASAVGEAINDTGDNVIEVIIPYAVTNKTLSGVYRYHGSSVDTFTMDDTKSGLKDTYYYENGSIHIFSTKFSTYAVSYTEYEPSKSHGSSSHSIKANDTANGKIEISKKYAHGGNKVEISVMADEGYILETLTVKNSKGDEIELTTVKVGENYTFKMPSKDVTVEATFIKDESIDLAEKEDCLRDESCVYAKFADADTKAWYHEGVHYCVENKLMSGITNTKFEPQGTATRAMLVTILWNMEDCPVVNYAMSFEDVLEDKWYTEAIRWAKSTGIVDGYNSKTFGPSDKVTREQMAVVLYNYAKYHKVSVDNTNMLNEYTDKSQIDTWALDAMEWANFIGIIKGRTATTIDPKATITRAEVATMIQRYCQKSL